MAELKENKPIVVGPHKPIKVLLKTVCQQITCFLCKGYLIDATTIVECLHSFCHSCIINHLKAKQYCPICEMMINKAKPNIKRDATLQAIVYKLVPGLYERELLRKRAFYKSRPNEAILASPEERGEDTEHLIFSPTENIPLSLEYADMEEIEDQIELGQPRHLKCPAGFPISHMKKYVLTKFGIDSNQFCVEIMYKVKTIVLPDHYSLMDVAYIYTWKRDAPMKFFFRVRHNETSPEELPEVPLRRSPSISDRKAIPSEPISAAIDIATTVLTPATDTPATDTPATDTTTADTTAADTTAADTTAADTPVTDTPTTNTPAMITESSHSFVKPKSPKSPKLPKLPKSPKSPKQNGVPKCEIQSDCDADSNSVKTDELKRTSEVRKSVNNEKSDKSEPPKRNSELRKSTGNERNEKKIAKDDEKNQKVKSVKKHKEDNSEKRVENIKLKIDLSRQNSVTIIKSSANDLKMKFKTERDNKSKSPELFVDKHKEDSVGKRKQEIDVIKLAKVTEKSNTKDSEVKYEIKSPKNNGCSAKAVVKIECDIKVESDIDEKKSEFLESFQLTPTKSLSPEKLAIIAENKRIENATAIKLLSAKKDMLMKGSTKIVPWHKPCDEPTKQNSKSSNECVNSNDVKLNQKNVSAKLDDPSKHDDVSPKDAAHIKQSVSPTPSSSGQQIKPSFKIVPRPPFGKTTTNEKTHNAQAKSKPGITTHSNAPNKDNPLKTTITKSSSLSPKLSVDKCNGEVTKEAIVSQSQASSVKSKVITEPTTSKRKSKEPVKNVPKRRFSLSLESPLSEFKLPSMPSSTIDDTSDKSSVEKEIELKSVNSSNRIWCVDPHALAVKNSESVASIQESKKNGNKTNYGNVQKKEAESNLGKMLPPVSTNTPRKSTDTKTKTKVRLNTTKTLSGPRKLPTILPKPSSLSQAPNMPQIAKMLKNPDTEIKQIPNGKDIKVYGPAMDMPTRPLGSSSPAYVPAFNSTHRNPSVGYLNYALMNSRNRTNDLPLGMRSPAYSPPSPIYSPNSPQYTPNYNIPVQPNFKYMKSPAYVPNFQPLSSNLNGSNGSNALLKVAAPSPKKPEKLNENNKRPLSNSGDGNSPPEKQAKVQSLLESCKINFPSSLSITLHEQNDSSLNNPLFNPKRNSPVNNYIEIVKLPEIPAKEEIKPMSHSKCETTKTPIGKPLAPKPSTPKPISPKPQIGKTSHTEKVKVIADTNTFANNTSESKKSPDVCAIPDLNPIDKNITTILKGKRNDKETGYQGKFLESILDKKRTVSAPPAAKIAKLDTEPSNGVTGSKKSTTPPLAPKTSDTNVTLKSLLKNNEKVKSAKPVSPNYPSAKQNKSDRALDLSTSVNLANKTSNNNNNKTPLDQSDFCALYNAAIARVNYNPSYVLNPSQVNLHVQHALLLEQIRKAGQQKLSEALETYIKNLQSKNTETL